MTLRRIHPLLTRRANATLALGGLGLCAVSIMLGGGFLIWMGFLVAAVACGAIGVIYIQRGSSAARHEQTAPHYIVPVALILVVMSAATLLLLRRPDKKAQTSEGIAQTTAPAQRPKPPSPSVDAPKPARSNPTPAPVPARPKVAAATPDPPELAPPNVPPDGHPPSSGPASPGLLAYEIADPEIDLAASPNRIGRVAVVVKNGGTTPGRFRVAVPKIRVDNRSYNIVNSHFSNWISIPAGQSHTLHLTPKFIPIWPSSSKIVVDVMVQYDEAKSAPCQSVQFNFTSHSPVMFSRQILRQAEHCL